ncbi:hypothetical protein JVT61DRAFT_13712 [Boletus reticuloceps]|uniref:Uncharacterized protein n=1 Tax=Boletus reticuloceps TaxID=495285 RepID=A0A8I3AC37_9AGAM|nr:hypothetical protein JVT61DRAFT_13712 [Boletus reticuloceps]
MHILTDGVLKLHNLSGQSAGRWKNRQLQCCGELTAGMTGMSGEFGKAESRQRKSSTVDDFNLDRSTATQFGKLSTTKEDYIMWNSADWYQQTPHRDKYYIHLCANSQLLHNVAIDVQEGHGKHIICMQHSSELEIRTRTAEEGLVQALNRNHELQGRLDALKTLEENLMQQASRLLSECDQAMEKLANMQASKRVRSFEMTKTLVEWDALVDKLKLLDSIKHEVNMYRDK